MRRLSGKVALVTGAAQGIGRAIGERFLAEGAFVWFSDRKAFDLPALEQSGELALDVAQEEDWLTAERKIRTESGRLDILVNNAGITGFEHGPGPFDPENCSFEDWRLVHAVNLDGTFLGCRMAIKLMRENGGSGSIINISSRSGLVGIPGAAAYASSKAGIRNHSKSVALWCANQGLTIRCNSIHPAAIMTPIWDEMVGDGPDRQKKLYALVADTPLKRFGTVEEVAAMAAYLASDESAYVTGSEFTIDGGLLAGSAASPG